MSDESTDVDAAREALDDTRRRLAGVPAEVVVTNHVMGLYELAAIHLSTEPPDLASAQLAIDAVRALVDTLGDRLGGEADVLHAALSNIQMAFVEVKRRTEAFVRDAAGGDREGAADVAADAAPPANGEDTAVPDDHDASDESGASTGEATTS